MIQLRWLSVAMVLGGFACAPSAFAQQGYMRPGGPISPWMNLFQKQPGPLDNYHTYVQPQFQLQHTIGQQNAALRQQSANIATLGQQMAKTQSGGQIAPTGTGGAFMHYSHYYPTKGAGASARPQTSGMAMPANSRAQMAKRSAGGY